MRLERTPGQFLVKARTSRSCGCARWSSTTSTCWRGFGFGDLEPELQRLLLDEEVRRLRAADLPLDLTLRTPDGDEWTVGAGTASVVRRPGRRCSAGSGRGLTDGLTGDPLPRLPEGR